MAPIEQLGALLIYRSLLGYLVLVAPVVLFVFLTLPPQCPLWEVFALGGAFASALSLLFAITSVACEAAADAVNRSCSLFDQLGPTERFHLRSSPCQP
jgi:hypothetical protein